MYHINPQTKIVTPCGAMKGGCPFREGENHFETLQEANREVERRLEREHRPQPLTKPRVGETREQWEARHRSEAEGSLKPSHLSSELYQRMLSPQHGALASYAHRKGFSPEEMQALRKVLDGDPKLAYAPQGELLSRVLEKRVAEAETNCSKIDEGLTQSFFFASPRIRSSGTGLILTSYATVGEEDFITHMKSDGSVRFEVYEHSSGESYSASTPSSFVDDGSGALNSWLTYYNAYREHLWGRLQWEREKRERVARREALSV